MLVSRLSKRLPLRWRDHQFATGHAFAHVVVAIALKVHVQTPSVPDAETLSRRARELQGNGVFFHARIAVPLGNLTGQACTD